MSLIERCVSDNHNIIKACTNLAFEPTFDFKTSWILNASSKPILTKGHVIASGKLTAGIKISITAEHQDSVNKTVTILTRRFIQSYPVGPVPVFQVTTLTLKLYMEGKINAKLTSQIVAKASSKASMGAKFDPATGKWVNNSSSGLEFSLDTSEAVPDLEGSVTGEIRLIPELSVRFYAVVGPKISIEPSLMAKLTVEDAYPLTKIGYPPVQISGFDVSSQIDVKLGISLGAFGQFAKLDSANLFSKSWDLLNLPQLSVSGCGGEVDEPIQLTGNTTDGVNNKFNNDTIQWFVDPSASNYAGQVGLIDVSMLDLT